MKLAKRLPCLRAGYTKHCVCSAFYMAYGLDSCVYIHTLIANIYNPYLQLRTSISIIIIIMKYVFISLFLPFFIRDFFVHHVTYAQCKKTFTYATAATCDNHTARRTGRAQRGAETVGHRECKVCQGRGKTCPVIVLWNLAPLSGEVCLWLCFGVAVQFMTK